MPASGSWPRSCSPRGRRSSSITSCRKTFAARSAPGQRVRAPFGRGDRLATGYCIAIDNRPAGPRRLKPLDSLVDRQPLLSPAMLRLAAWMVDYYLCTWAQVLEALVPAGVRFQAGTRATQLVSLPGEVAAKLPELKLTAKQRAIVEALAAARGPLPIGASPVPPAARWCRSAPCAQGPRPVDRRAPRRFATCRDGRHRPRRPSEAEPRSAPGPGRHPRALGSRPARDDPGPRRHRQRQDRDLHSGHPGSAPLRPPGDRAGARDQPHAADRGAVPLALRPRGPVAQPLERRRAPPPLGTDRRRRRAGHRRRPQRRLRAHAPPGPDRARRGARIDVQAGCRPPLPRPRRRARTGPRRTHSAGARFGHALAGKLATRRRGPVPPGVDAAARLRPAAAGGGHDRLAQRSPRSPQPRRDQPPVGPGHGSHAQGGRPDHPVAQSPRLLDPHPVPGLRPHGRMPPLRDRADAPSARARRLVPLLRLPHARARRLPEVQLRGHPLRRLRHPAARGRGAGPLSPPRLPADGHRHHAKAGQPRTGPAAVSRRRGAHPAGHADDRQGARLSQRDAGGRDQCRHRPAPARLPRRRAHLSARDAGGRPHGPRRARRAGARANLQPRPPGNRSRRAPRLRNVRPRRAADSRAVRLSAVFQHGPPGRSRTQRRHDPRIRRSRGRATARRWRRPSSRGACWAPRQRRSPSCAATTAIKSSSKPPTAPPCARSSAR